MLRIAAALCLLALPALAQSQDDVLSARLLPGWAEQGGTRMAAISLTLAPGWKTYWRAPGEAGIPPTFDWSASQNVKSVELHWPAPRVILLNGMQSIGYFDALTLPIRITPLDPAQPVHLAVKMDLGVCHDICMPAALDLSTDLSGAGAPDAAISKALQAGPTPAARAGLAASACLLEPIKDGLRLTAHLTLPDAAAVQAVAIEAAEPGLWISQTMIAGQGQALTATADLVPPDGQPFALDRSGLTLTVLSQGRAVELRGCPAG